MDYAERCIYKQDTYLSAFNSDFSTKYFSKQIQIRDSRDAQYGAEKPATFIGEDQNGVQILLGGSPITDELSSYLLSIDLNGNIITTNYSGKASAGGIKLGSSAINIDHGNAHFFASEGDKNEVSTYSSPRPK